MNKPTAQELWGRIHKDIHVLCGYCNDDGWVQHELEELIEEYCDAYHEEQMREKKERWIKYIDQKPENGKLVMVYRDIDSKQIYVTHWNDDDELYADWNEVTHWAYINYPTNPQTND